MINAKRMPGFTRTADFGGMKARPQIVHLEGKSFVVVHAEGLTTGMMGKAPDNLRPCITIWSDPSSIDPTGMALTFTPSDEMLDTIINSLTHMRERTRAAASEQARAAIRKAAGR